MSDETLPTRGQFEIERDGETAFLAYEVDGQGWISLLHTQVPEPVRGQGIANELARTALEYAKEHQLKVDVVCPVVFHYVNTHPEYKPLLGIRGYR
jgi:predicted GNAT family acetyltransferase